MAPFSPDTIRMEHFCSICRKPRSRSYQQKHPLVNGETPVPGVCTRCLRKYFYEASSSPSSSSSSPAAPAAPQAPAVISSSYPQPVVVYHFHHYYCGGADSKPPVFETPEKPQMLDKCAELHSENVQDWRDMFKDQAPPSISSQTKPIFSFDY